jgi:hypothetical protein
MTDGNELSRRGVLRGTAGAATAGLLGIAGTGATGAEPADEFEAGAARVDASPRPRHLDEGVYLGGFGIGPQPSRKATGNHDGVSARAIAVRAGDETVVQATFGATGLGNRQQRAVRQRVADSTGLDESRVLISATHSHAGPDFQGLWGGVPESYREFVVDRLTTAIERAVASLQPAELVAGSVDAAALASNRRYDDDDEFFQGTDSTLTVLQFTATDESGGPPAFVDERAEGDLPDPDTTGAGETVATLLNFAAHPTTIGSGNAKVATDYVGPCERAVEDAHGGTALYLMGAIGDASASGPGGETDYDEARNYGQALAERADDALDDASAVSPGLGVRTANVRLPIDNCLFKAGFESGLLRPYYDGESVVDTAASPAQRLAESVSDPLGDAIGTAREPAPELGALAIRSPVARVTFGTDGDRVELLTVPGEGLTSLGVQLRGILGGAEQVVAGLTQNTLGYLIPQHEFDDGYEETVSLGPDTAPLYLNGVYSVTGRTSERYTRSPSQENVCPAGQAQFASFRNQFESQLDASDGPMGVSPPR